VAVTISILCDIIYRNSFNNYRSKEAITTTIGMALSKLALILMLLLTIVVRVQSYLELDKEEPPTYETPMGMRAQALYDYIPQGEGELELRAGDVVNVLAQPTPEWWEGEIEGRPGWIGLFPANYVKVLSNPFN